MEDTLLSVNQVAKFLGMSAFTVRRLARLGLIPAAKIGRTYRFSKVDIETFIRDQYGKKETNANAGTATA